jgi:hypothetical protein
MRNYSSPDMQENVLTGKYSLPDMQENILMNKYSFPDMQETVPTAKNTGLHQKAFCVLLYGKYAALQQGEQGI